MTQSTECQELQRRLDKVIKQTAHDISHNSNYALIDLLYIKTGRHPTTDSVYEWAKKLVYRK